jgi:hypothetical protein
MLDLHVIVNLSARSYTFRCYQMPSTSTCSYNLTHLRSNDSFPGKHGQTVECLVSLFIRLRNVLARSPAKECQPPTHLLLLCLPPELVSPLGYLHLDGFISEHYLPRRQLISSFIVLGHGDRGISALNGPCIRNIHTNKVSRNRYHPLDMYS